MGIKGKYRAFIIDLDGVVYLLNDPLPGAIEALRRLSENGVPFVFLTNNSSTSPEQYAGKLHGMGLEVEPDAFVTSGQAVACHLSERWPEGGARAFVIGEEGLTRQVEGAGLSLLEPVDSRGADVVVVGWDRAFDFEKLKAAVVAIRNGAYFVATNGDSTYPTPEGLWPGAGALVAAVSTGAGTEPYVAGKPNPLMVELALERMGARRGETLLVGDRLDTDVAVGLAAGVDTLLVLTGISSLEEVEATGIRPTSVAGSLAEALLD
ncbi:MAG: HAD-IIA family hydrolase [Actinobacteria bacterium]|nr:HAD-IIA family hydrolase [Actinomycetota bacterium]MBU1942366.1 HAD-IIA family hydrolase [Actinomycetota bacterium]MBU2689281.1 HAD-IIA family hydrolase [Actinomycetota bacterium]